jgi:hypothetical protein
VVVGNNLPNYFDQSMKEVCSNIESEIFSLAKKILSEWESRAIYEKAPDVYPTSTNKEEINIGWNDKKVLCTLRKDFTLTMGKYESGRTAECEYNLRFGSEEWENELENTCLQLRYFLSE